MPEKAIPELERALEIIKGKTESENGLEINKGQTESEERLKIKGFKRQIESVVELKCSCLNYLAAALMNLGKYDEAEDYLL